MQSLFTCLLSCFCLLLAEIQDGLDRDIIFTHCANCSVPFSLSIYVHVIEASLSEPHTSGTVLHNPSVYIYIYIYIYICIYIPYIAPRPHATGKRNRLDNVIQ